MTLALHCLPENPGLASGINACLIGIGSLIFNFIGTLVINPHNISPTLQSTNISIFDTSVSESMPFMFQVIFVVCLGIIILCIFMIKDIPVVQNEEIEQISVRNSIRTREFWLLFFCFSLTCVGPVYVVQKYKDIANYLDIFSDQSLAALGSIGALLSSFCKLFFGHMNDKYGFKIVYTIIIVQILVVGLGFNFGADYSAVFAFYICISYVSLGGHYTILAPICRKLFGRVTGMKAWGILYMTIGIGTLLAFITQVLVPNIAEYAFVISITSGLAFLALASMFIFRELPVYQDESCAPLLDKENSRVLT
jgi:nitrate/nitrite transporter NarK